MSEVRTATAGETKEQHPNPYVIIGDNDYGRMQKKLDEHAAKGYRPVLMTSAAGPRRLEITVILEHVSLPQFR